jgi:putative spermidine/putrescine transport system permease protein
VERDLDIEIRGPVVRFAPNLKLLLPTVPLVLYLSLFYALPVLSMLSLSVSGKGGSVGAFSQVFGDAAFWRVIQITATISLVTTAVCLLIGYPLALFMARLGKTSTNLVMMLVLVPFWTSILVRTYAWMVVLGRPASRTTP